MFSDRLTCCWLPALCRVLGQEEEVEELRQEFKETEDTYHIQLEELMARLAAAT